MSDESPTRRLSEIFGSLSCLADLKTSLESQLQVNGHGNSTTINNQHQSGHGNVASSSSTASNGASPRLSRLSAQFTGSTPTALPISVVRSVTMGSRSTPNSPRLMPKRSRAVPPPQIPQRPNATMIANPSLAALDAEAPWPHFSLLTDHLDVHQVNNYNQGLPEINWQERCLELQLELHRSKSQAGRIRDMLRDKVGSVFFSGV